MLAPIAFVLLMALGYQKLSTGAMQGLFLAFAAINGISFSFILLHYITASILGCFLSAAGLFAVMALYGHMTKRSLSGLGSILTVALIGILLSLVINTFLQSAMLDYLVSIAGVVVFSVLTAYDMQKIKERLYGIQDSEIELGKIIIWSALDLYLDLVNIFLFLLRLFGEGDDD